MSKLLTKADIMSASDIKTIEVEVPEWGGHVFLKGLSAKEKDAFDNSLMDVDKRGRVERNSDNYKARLVARMMVDDKGDPIFNPKFDAEHLGLKGSSALKRLSNKCRELNGESLDDEDEVRNFKTTPAADSSTD